MSQAEEIYRSLLESGALTTLYTSMKGDWEQDKKSFLKQYEENEKLINDTGTLDLDEVDDYMEDDF